MDKSIRRNELCVVGLPRCDFVFSSTRTCFIAYGFDENSLEMELLQKLLLERSIEPVQAGATLAPGKNAFCTKICSKIITSQFCIVLLNNEKQDDHRFTNANVNMEYGLMLGFNKYVIPFQLSSQTLPFNVAGLDTVMYTRKDFTQLATRAIDNAIKETQQTPDSAIAPDQNIALFLLSKRALVASLDDGGSKAIFDMGSPLGFNLLHDFSGGNYLYFGNFTMLRSDALLWRINMLEEIIVGRTSSLLQRYEDGLLTASQHFLSQRILETMRIWVLVTNLTDKNLIESNFKNKFLTHKLEIFSLSDVSTELSHFSNAS